MRRFWRASFKYHQSDALFPDSSDAICTVANEHNKAVWIEDRRKGLETFLVYDHHASQSQVRPVDYLDVVFTVPLEQGTQPLSVFETAQNQLNGSRPPELRVGNHIHSCAGTKWQANPHGVSGEEIPYFELHSDLRCWIKMGQSLDIVGQSTHRTEDDSATVITIRHTRGAVSRSWA